MFTKVSTMGGPNWLAEQERPLAERLQLVSALPPCPRVVDAKDMIPQPGPQPLASRIVAYLCTHPYCKQPPLTLPLAEIVVEYALPFIPEHGRTVRVDHSIPKSLPSDLKSEEWLWCGRSAHILSADGDPVFRSRFLNRASLREHESQMFELDFQHGTQALRSAGTCRSMDAGRLPLHQRDRTATQEFKLPPLFDDVGVAIQLCSGARHYFRLLTSGDLLMVGTDGALYGLETLPSEGGGGGGGGASASSSSSGLRWRWAHLYEPLRPASFTPSLGLLVSDARHVAISVRRDAFTSKERPLRWTSLEYLVFDIKDLEVAPLAAGGPRPKPVADVVLPIEPHAAASVFGGFLYIVEGAEKVVRVHDLLTGEAHAAFLVDPNWQVALDGRKIDGFFVTPIGITVTSLSGHSAHDRAWTWLRSTAAPSMDTS